MVRTTRHGRLAWLWCAAIGPGLLVGPVGCSSESRYRVLTVFFEGVPAPGSTAEAQGPAAEGRGKRLENPTSAHTAFREGLCRLCHITDLRPLKTTVPELCWECHEPPPENKPWNHGPARAGDCLVCHVGHEAMLPALLKAEGKALCYTCHRDSYIESLPLHRAVDLENCERCHPAHEGGTIEKPAQVSAGAAGWDVRDQKGPEVEGVEGGSSEGSVRSSPTNTIRTFPFGVGSAQS